MDAWEKSVQVEGRARAKLRSVLRILRVARRPVLGHEEEVNSIVG